MRLLLHACCGPCLIEPLEEFSATADELVIVYTNSNIHPAEEYERRRDTLRAYADSLGRHRGRTRLRPGGLGRGCRSARVVRGGAVPRVLSAAAGRGSALRRREWLRRHRHHAHHQPLPGSRGDSRGGPVGGLAGGHRVARPRLSRRPTPRRRAGRGNSACTARTTAVACSPRSRRARSERRGVLEKAAMKAAAAAPGEAADD